MPAFFALSSAKASGLLLITPTISVFVMVPSATLSIIAWRFVPPPDTNANKRIFSPSSTFLKLKIKPAIYLTGFTSFFTIWGHALLILY